jgi:hypothetical protein
MKILHSITCTVWQPLYNAYETFQRSLIRPRRLTEKGIERMFKRGCDEYPPCDGIHVARVETAIFYR